MNKLSKFIFILLFISFGAIPVGNACTQEQDDILFCGNYHCKKYKEFLQAQNARTQQLAEQKRKRIIELAKIPRTRQNSNSSNSSSSNAQPPLKKHASESSECSSLINQAAPLTSFSAHYIAQFAANEAKRVAELNKKYAISQFYNEQRNRERTIGTQDTTGIFGLRIFPLAPTLEVKRIVARNHYETGEFQKAAELWNEVLQIAGKSVTLEDLQAANTAIKAAAADKVTKETQKKY